MVTTWDVPTGPAEGSDEEDGADGSSAREEDGNEEDGNADSEIRRQWPVLLFALRSARSKHTRARKHTQLVRKPIASA